MLIRREVSASTIFTISLDKKEVTKYYQFPGRKEATVYQLPGNQLVRRMLWTLIVTSVLSNFNPQPQLLSVVTFDVTHKLTFMRKKKTKMLDDFILILRMENRWSRRRLLYNKQSRYTRTIENYYRSQRIRNA